MMKKKLMFFCFTLSASFSGQRSPFLWIDFKSPAAANSLAAFFWVVPTCRSRIDGNVLVTNGFRMSVPPAVDGISCQVSLDN